MVDQRSGAAGFTLIELLVTMALFSVVSVGFYQVLFAGTRAADVSQSTVRQSEEARLGFNRMIRDTREATRLLSPTATSFQVEIDFDGDGTPEPTPTDLAGDYEQITFAWNAGERIVTATAGGLTEALMRGVDCIRKADNSCHSVFTYTSSRLEFDLNANGVATSSELDASTVGNNNGVLDGDEIDMLDAVTFSLRVIVDGRATNFYAEAQMRNRR